MAALFTSNFLLLTTLVVFCGLGDFGHGLRIDISPSSINKTIMSVPSVVNISCIPSVDLDQDAIEILIIEIRRENQIPIATVGQRSGVSYKGPSNQTADVRVSGHINTTVFSESSLKLTLLNPKSEDSGLYECVVFYLDRNTGVLSEKVSRANLTINEDEDKEGDRQLGLKLKYLIERVSNLETEMEKREQSWRDNQTLLINQVIVPMKNEILKQDLKTTRLETDLKELSEKEAELKVEVSSLKQLLQQQQLQISKQANDSSYTLSAFSATYSVKGRQRVGDTIVFNHVIMKVGDQGKGQGYDESTGLFTAPVSGLYGFHVAAATEYAGGYINLELRVNEKPVIGLEIGDNTYDDQSACSVLLTLEVGDVVRVAVRNNGGGTIDPRDYTAFSGYLIHPINN